MPEKMSAEPGIKVVGLAGSPRAGGNTDMLLDRFLEGAESAGARTDRIRLAGSDVEPCQGCDGCFEDGKCVVQDSLDSVLDAILAANVVCLCVPVFFASVPAQTKALIDRCQCLWVRKYVLKRKPPPNRGLGIVISVGGTGGERAFEGVLLTTKYFFDVLGVDMHRELLFRNVDEAGAIAGVEGALESAHDLGVEAVKEAMERIRTAHDRGT